MKNLIPVLTALSLVACGKFEPHHIRTVTSESLPSTSTPGPGLEPLAIERAGLPAATRSALTIAGTCIQGAAIRARMSEWSVDRRESCSSNGRFSFVVDFAGPDGLKTIVVTTQDGAGRTFSDSVSVMVDMTAPAINVSAIQCASTGSTVSGMCESGRMVEITGALNAPVSVMCANGIFGATIALTSGSGAKAIQVAQSDALGNRSAVSSSCTVTAVQPQPTPVPPVVTVSQPAAGAYVKTSVQVIGTCTSGIPVVLYGAGVATQVSAACTAGVFSGSVTLTAGEGAKEIRAGQTNSANQSASVARSVVKDTVAPSVAISGPSAGTIASTGVTIQGTCESGLQVMLEGAGLASSMMTACSAGAFSAGVVFSSGSGTKAVSVSQTDSAGNTASVSRSFVKGDVILDGVALYNTNCMGCHGGIAMSQKRGRTALQISGAIAGVPVMGSLVSLSSAQIAAIASALNAAPAVDPAVTDIDKFYQSTDPQLYASARKYFPADEAVEAPKRIFRLTRKQLDVSLRAILPAYFTAQALPRDPLQTNYEYAEIIGINAGNFPKVDEWIQAIVAKVRANPTAVVNCASSSNSVSCLQTQARAFVTKAFRGDVTEAKLTELASFYSTSVSSIGLNEATADLVDLVLSSPRFLYREEFQTDSAGKLIAPEYLQNITYTLADAPAEQVKLSSGSAATAVQTAAAVKATSDAILATPEAREKLVRFFQSWLEVREPGEFTISTADFPEFTPALAQAMVTETQTFLTHHLTKAAPKLKDITQSTQSFVSSTLASIYDVNPAGLTGTTLVNLDPTKRLGIFSQGAVLASHSGPTTTRPVKRGVFWVRKVMCQQMEPPPAGTNTALPTQMYTTERQRIESVTNQATCMGCHSVINPFGFMQENYGATGKWRTTDNGYPIDAGIVSNVLDEGPVSTNQPVEALKSFTNSIMFKQCFVRQLFRFYMGRDETSADHRVLREMFYAFTDGDKQEIVTLLQILANSSRISTRR